MTDHPSSSVPASEAMQFTRANAAHRSTLLLLMREFYAFEHLAWDEAEARGALDTLLGDTSLGEVWLAVRGGEAAGYFVLSFGFSLEFRGRFALLDELFLREGHRGGGLGRRAMEQAVRACRAQGIHALRLEVEHRNGAAQAFYRRLGFHAHERHLMTRWIDADPPTEAATHGGEGRPPA